MSDTQQPRQASGIPAAGQWASAPRAASGVALPPGDAPDRPIDPDAHLRPQIIDGVNRGLWGSLTDEEMDHNEARESYRYPAEPISASQIVDQWSRLDIPANLPLRVQNAYETEVQELYEVMARENGHRPHWLRVAARARWDREWARMQSETPRRITASQIGPIIEAARIHWDAQRLTDPQQRALIENDLLYEIHGIGDMAPAEVVSHFRLDRLREVIENPSSLTLTEQRNRDWVRGYEADRQAEIVGRGIRGEY